MECSVDTLKVVKALGHDTPLIWEEVDSGVRIKATEYEMLRALFDANQILSFEYFVSLNDFITSFDSKNVQIPPETDKNKMYSGWSSSCFDCWDGMWIDITYTYREENGQIIFPFYFIIPYCEACLDCDGCECKRTAEFEYKLAN